MRKRRNEPTRDHHIIMITYPPTYLLFDVHTPSWLRSDAGTSSLDDRIFFLFQQLSSLLNFILARFSIPSSSSPYLHIFCYNTHVHTCFPPFLLRRPFDISPKVLSYFLFFLLHFFYFLLTKNSYIRDTTNIGSANAGDTKGCIHGSVS